MMTRNSDRLLSFALGLFLVPVLLTACQKKLKPVEVEITDPVRHYYPVIQGEMLAVTYEIENVSGHPLFIREVQTSCGCLIPRDDLPLVILPKRTGKLRLFFDTIKNSGFVSHYVWCYGNFADSTWRELRFTTNVVPSADYVHDYEELFQNRESESWTFKDLVDGRSADKGYYIDDGTDPRAEELRKAQEAADRLAF